MVDSVVLAQKVSCGLVREDDLFESPVFGVDEHGHLEVDWVQSVDPELSG